MVNHFEALENYKASIRSCAAASVFPIVQCLLSN